MVCSLILPLFAQNIASSYKFIQKNSDACITGQGGADMVIFSASALQNNNSALSFTHKGFELSSSYIGETLLNNSFSLLGYFDYKKVKLGFKGFYLVSSDKYSGDFNTDFNTLYSGGSVGGALSFLLGDLLSFIRIPVAVGAGLNVLGERVFSQRSAAFLFDFSTTVGLMDKKLFLAAAMYNWGPGLENTEAPKSISAGAKYIIDKYKLVDLEGNIAYRINELNYNHLALGMKAVFLLNYSISFGYNFDILKRSRSFNHGFNFGLGFKLGNYRLQLAVSPRPGFTTEYVATFKYVFVDEFVGVPLKVITTLSLKNIIRECKKGIRHEKWDYAKEMAKEGLSRDPDNEELIELVMQIKNELGED